MGAICCITNRKDEEERKKKIEDRKKLEEEDYPQPKITINEHLDENNNSIRHERRLMRDKKSKTMRNYRSQDSKRDSFSYAELNSNPSNIMDLFCKNFDEKTMVLAATTNQLDVPKTNKNQKKRSKSRSQRNLVSEDEDLP